METSWAGLYPEFRWPVVDHHGSYDFCQADLSRMDGISSARDTPFSSCPRVRLGKGLWQGGYVGERRWACSLLLHPASRGYRADRRKNESCSRGSSGNMGHCATSDALV